MSTPQPITIAIPKGRLQQQVFEYLALCNMPLPDPKRNLIIEDATSCTRILLVKNSDLPQYVHGGIAAIGIVGTDILNESPHSFFTLGYFPFGKTKICLIGKSDTPSIDRVTHTTVATKYTKFTHKFLQDRNVQAKLIKLNGSIEIAPLLGLAPYIVDLVETGRTLKENGLSILEQVGTTRVALIANKSLYKLNYKDINKVVRNLKL